MILAPQIVIMPNKSMEPLSYKLLNVAFVQSRQRKIKKKVASHFVNQSILIQNYNIHIFYFTWFHTPKFDQYYTYWNLPYIQESLREDILMPKHAPPHDISSCFFPLLGCYSSNDPEVLDIHFREIKAASIGVVVVSIFPLSNIDRPTLPLYFKAAEKHSLKIAFQVSLYFLSIKKWGS